MKRYAYIITSTHLGLHFFNGAGQPAGVNVSFLILCVDGGRAALLGHT